MKIPFCEGPLQDDCGCWYCPRNPETDPTEENCKLCVEMYDYAIDQEIDRREAKEFEERRSIKWGE